MTRETISNEQGASALHTDISQTRRRMDDTLDRLAERLQPRHLLNDLLDFWQVRRSRHGNGHHLRDGVQDNARKAGQVLMTQIRENPMPALLIGAGVAWLLMGRGESDGPHREAVLPRPSEPEDVFGEAPVGAATEPVGDQRGTIARKAGEIQEKLKDRGQHLKQRAAEKGEHIRSRAQDVGRQVQAKVRQGYEQTEDRVRQGYQVAQQRFHEAADEHPLATGAAFLGIGLLAGFLLPKTEREDEWFGETSSNVRERVKDAGRDLVERGTHVARAAADAAKEAAEQHGLTPQHLKEGVQAVAQQVKEAATRTAQQEGITSGGPPTPAAGPGNIGENVGEQIEKLGEKFGETSQQHAA